MDSKVEREREREREHMRGIGGLSKSDGTNFFKFQPIKILKQRTAKLPC